MNSVSKYKTDSPFLWPDRKQEWFLDTIMAKVFSSNQAGFYSHLMVSLDNKVTDELPTAATDGESLFFNLEYLVSLDSDRRLALFLHEVLHVAYLHGVRRGSRTPRRWNYACDYKINLDLVRMGYKLGDGWLIDYKYEGMSEEEIYALLPVEELLPSGDFGIGEDVKGIPKEKEASVIAKVAGAIQQAKMINSSGGIPGNMEEVIYGLLKPIVPWERILRRFFTDYIGVRSSWGRPNRRHQTMYMPSRVKELGKLQSLNVYRDTSGSISTELNRRFSSELDYIWNTIRPKEMRIIQFDKKIQKVTIIKDKDSFDDFKVKGRGGTSLACVHEHILESNPNLVVVMSDMECGYMSQEGIDMPILWLRVGNFGHIPKFGEVVNIPNSR